MKSELRTFPTLHRTLLRTPHHHCPRTSMSVMVIMLRSTPSSSSSAPTPTAVPRSMSLYAVSAAAAAAAPWRAFAVPPATTNPAMDAALTDREGASRRTFTGRPGSQPCRRWARSGAQRGEWWIWAKLWGER